MSEIENLTYKETFSLAIKNHRKNNLKSAIKYYNETLNKNPNHLDSLNNLGIVYLQQSDLLKAKKYYEMAINLKPDYANAHNNLGIVFEKIGKIDEAISSYDKTIEIDPKNVDAYNNLGNIYRKISKFDQSIFNYQKALSLNNKYVKAHFNLANVLKKVGRFDEAIISFEKAIDLKPDYDEAKHLLASLTGKTTTKAPRAYVEQLFDQYAKNFEDSLVNKLDYKTPKKIVEIIHRNTTDNFLGSVLDLGCGTGLVGVELKKLCLKLVGIDLSEGMLKISKGKNIYDNLIKDDIVNYLSNSDLNYNYYISADVFIYVGDLDEIFKLIKNKNKPEGKIVFTTEHNEKDGFFLEKSGRYSHSKSYIENLCTKYDYVLKDFEKFELRKSKNSIITGGLYLLEF